MEKTLDKRFEDLERKYTDLSESNSKLWVRVTELAETVERMGKSEVEFVKKVNEDQKKMIKTLNELRDNLLFLSTKGSKPS